MPCRLSRRLLAVSIAVAACSGAAAPAQAEYRWAQGSFLTYKSDGGAVDARIHTAVRYERYASPSPYVHVSHAMVAGGNHMWNKLCGGPRGFEHCTPLFAYTSRDRWSVKKLNWNVPAGSPFTFWVTNSSWDFSGFYGETWTGVVSIPR